ncbi:hypothetical protein TNCV_4625601 [Trichonephila clavipes]|nr:hypothetical protein TNCV_4625601 [Trichonephila clavipes]
MALHIKTTFESQYPHSSLNVSRHFCGGRQDTVGSRILYSKLYIPSQSNCILIKPGTMAIRLDDVQFPAL